MTRLLGAIGLALLSIGGSPLTSQDLEAFDLSDFLDPALLVVEEDDGTSSPVWFFASRVSFGFLDGYQRRDLISGSGTGYGFSRWSGSLYQGKNQLNLELTGFSGLGRVNDEIVDARIQFARYFQPPATGTELDSDTGGVEEAPSRVLLSYRSTDPDIGGFRDEVSLMLEVAIPGTEESPGKAYGGYVLTYQPDTGDYFLSFVERGTVRTWRSGVRLDAGLSTGMEQVDGHTVWGHTRLELSLVAPVPRTYNSYLHLVYAPYYHAHPLPGRDSLGHEFGFFLNFGAFSKLVVSRPEVR